MGRGPGPWQRALLRVTGDGLVATTRAVMLDSVSQPTHSDHVCIRRAAKALAQARRIQAAYVYACPGCGAIRREGGPACCVSVRPMLAVAPWGSRVRHIAPPPVRPVPSWISAAPPLHPLARYEVASIPAALDLVIQHGMQRIWSGQAKIGASDVIAALRLRQQLEDAGQPSQARWQREVITLLDVAREQLGPEGFAAYTAAVKARLRA
jgi:hypothetical protein